MHNVEIEIFCIAQTRLNPEATRRWLDRCGATEYPVPAVDDGSGHHSGCPGSDVGPHSSCAEVTDAGAVCGLCAKRCYMSFEVGLNPNVTRVRKDWFEYLDNVIKSQHGSVIEHATWTFAIEGVSRVFTGEMNRHRAGVAISEGSMRYIRFDDIGFWMPHSLREGNMSLMPTKKCKACKGRGSTPQPIAPDIHQFEDILCANCNGTGRINQMATDVFEHKKALTRGHFENAFTSMESVYATMCRIWDIENLKDFDIKKKLTSMFRRVIGMGAATGGCWTMNTRALRHIAALRTAPGAEEEIAYVLGEIGKYMVESEPALFADFTRDEATGAWVPGTWKV